MTNNNSLSITRIFDAPINLVFDAWSDPEQLNKWSCPHGFEITFSEGDIKTGEKYRSCMEHPEYGKNIVAGKYVEVTPPSKIVFTHFWEEGDNGTNETLCTVELQDLGTKTQMTFTQSGFESIESRDGHEDGWSQCFEKLAELLGA